MATDRQPSAVTKTDVIAAVLVAALSMGLVSGLGRLLMPHDRMQQHATIAPHAEPFP